MHTAFFPLKAEFTDEEISRQAYALWLKRGRPKGYESEIWREAQMELQSSLWMKTKAKGRGLFQRKRHSSHPGFSSAVPSLVKVSRRED